MDRPSPPPMPANPPVLFLQQDAEHLRLLSIFHYVHGAIIGALSCLGLIYLVIGVLALSGKMPANNPKETELMGWMFTGVGLFITLLGWSLAISELLAGRWLAARRHRTFCFVVACIECLHMPLGTTLGVFTILVLQRPSVRALFEANNQPA